MVDPFLGSAASFDAAQKMGLDFRGYELDTDYYNAAKNRMAKGIQMQLL
jgi:DNA modification methylase